MKIASKQLEYSLHSCSMLVRHLGLISSLINVHLSARTAGFMLINPQVSRHCSGPTPSSAFSFKLQNPEFYVNKSLGIKALFWSDPEHGDAPERDFLGRMAPVYNSLGRNWGRAKKLKNSILPRRPNSPSQDLSSPW